MIQQLNLLDGKYTFQYNDETGELVCRRYGSDWRTFVGDKAVAALFCDAWGIRGRFVDPKVLKHHLDAISDEYGHGDIWQLLVRRLPMLKESA